MIRFTLIYLLGLFSISMLSAQECLNVDFKLRGYFYVGTSQEDTAALGGFYEEKSNTPKKVTTKLRSISAKDKFQIIVQTNAITDFSEGVSGFKVYIVNLSDSTVELPAQDSRIYLKRQVYYNKHWQDIEYLPSSWCGNSYHSVYIKPKEYWGLKAPCMEGKIPARFRFQLYISDDFIVNSNEFQGSFNKQQLKREQGHQPTSIMDPYNN